MERPHLVAKGTCGYGIGSSVDLQDISVQWFKLVILNILFQDANNNRLYVYKFARCMLWPARLTTTETEELHLTG